jgi:N-glycosylase/DNA lyase
VSCKSLEEAEDVDRKKMLRPLSTCISCILLMSMDQPSSIPVDRHVFQFAERWYHIKTKGGLKGYETIANRFRQLWGPYAGWAHSVLFTADLRAFATYKKEEEVKVELGKVKEELQESVLEETSLVKEETLREEPVFRNNGRPARLSEKRVLAEEEGHTLNETFRGVKRTMTRKSAMTKNRSA